jgi:hypothetical protein
MPAWFAVPVRLRAAHPSGCIAAAALLVLASAGCPSEDPAGTGSDTTTSASSTSASSASTSTATADTGGTTVADETGLVFLPMPDVEPPRFECNIYEQDCPPGEKCMIWASDANLYEEATLCFPVVDDPAASGEPCHVEGRWNSGIDDCDAETMCWEVDSETLEGVCRPFCGGSPSYPTCEDPGHVCIGHNYAPCVPICNPLEPHCATGRVCVPIGEVWICAYDASGDFGAYGDPCGFVNVCDPGLVCLGASAVPDDQPCMGSQGCCTEVCDISSPLGALQCSGVAGGQICHAWYAEATAPAGLENVGACAIPP